MVDDERVRARLQRRYGELAAVADGGVAGGCGQPRNDTPPAGAATGCCDTTAAGCGPSATAEGIWGAARYDAASGGGVSAEVVGTSLGCGNPVAMAELRPGEVVLDLGSGAGLDVILSARRVGPGGHAYGLDMTPEMLAAARANAAREGVANATFLEGCLEAVPLAAGSVDVILSNCVLNLSTDKPRAFAEMHRVLRPRGRLAISDVVAEGTVPERVRADPEAWDGCLAGALTRRAYHDHLAAAGFVDVTLTDSHPIDETLTSVVVGAHRPG